MKILHVMNDFPYPPIHGGRVDMWGRLRSLAESGHDVELIVTVKQRPSAENYEIVSRLVRRLVLVERLPLWRSILGARPMQVACRVGLKDVPLEGRFDVAIAEAEFCYPIFENPTLEARLKVLRVHNDERGFMSDLAQAERNAAKRMYFREEARRFSHFSPLAFLEADQLWFSSSKQCEENLKSKQFAFKSVWLPPPIDIRRLSRPVQKESRQVLFVGSFAAASNVEAVGWYLRNVHKRLKKINGYKFVIAGSTRGLSPDRILKRIHADEACSVHMDVPDLTDLYDESAVFVNCMIHGASIKMKTVNAVERGIAIVSTTVGNEGTGFKDGEHVRVADDPQEFAFAIEELLTRPSMAVALAERAQEFLQKNYQHSSSIQTLVSM